MVIPPRLKLVLADRGLEIALAFGVVGITMLAGAGYVYTNPDTRTVSEVTDQKSFSTAVETSAVVQGNTTLYEEGERLSDMPVYLFRATPDLTLTIRTTVPEGETVQVTHRLTLVIQAARDEEPFYTEERTLIEREHRTTNGSASDSTTVNVEEIRDRTESVREEISGAGTLSTRFNLVVEYETDRYNGQLVSGTSLQISESSYVLGGQLGASESHSEQVTRTVTDPPDVTTTAGLGALGLILLIGSIVMDRMRRRIDVEKILTTRDHARFEEWISNGEFPTEVGNRFTSINSLEDLVDVAIDSDKRVIFDRSLGAYAVVDGDVVYYYAEDPESIDPWLDA